MKYGSPKAELERQKLQTEIDALHAKIEVLESSKRSEELYEKAIKAFATYNGHGDDLDDFEETE
jgi:phage shock protein A